MLLAYLQAHTTEHGELYVLIHLCGVQVFLSWIISKCGTKAENINLEQRITGPIPTTAVPLFINTRLKYYLFILNTT